MKTLYIIIILIPLFFSCNDEPEPTGSETLESLKIAVLMPLSGSMQNNWNNGIEWFQETVNNLGGVNGKLIEIEWYDSQEGDIEDLASKIAQDTSIVAAIGPFTSSNAFKAAPYFIKNKKVLFLPTASSSEITTAYVGKGYVWRLVESDITQCKTLILLAKNKGAESIALITGDEEYGMTFYNWFGFFASEMGLEVTKIEQYDATTSDMTDPMYKVLNTNPDLVVCVPSNIDQAISMVNVRNESSQDCEFLFSDMAYMPDFLAQLGSDADGIEGTVCIADPTYGFDTAYEAKFGEKPLLAIAQLYDALMLITYGLINSKGETGEILNNAIKEIVDGTDGNALWDESGVESCMQDISNGIFPNILGASSALLYDNDYYLDLVSSTYAYWQVYNSNFYNFSYYADDASTRYSSTSAAWRTYAEEIEDLEDGPDLNLPEKTSLKALLIASSKEWTNYRHQADALAFYQLLKKNGVKDDDIILIIQDDIAYNDRNSDEGTIINEAEGENLYTSDIQIDYYLNDLTSDMLFNILKGNITDSTPNVITSDKQTNILFYLAGHGKDYGILLANEQEEYISPDEMFSECSEFSENQPFRRLLIVLETCYSGLIGQAIDIDSPILCITAANATESSKAINYSNSLNVWLSDNFSNNFFDQISYNDEISITDLYINLNKSVYGSHVSVYNEENFGNTSNINISEFINP